MALKRKVIFDGDPGADDFVAWLIALLSDEIEPLGICATHGNVPINLTARNALACLDYVGRSGISVYVGNDRALDGKDRVGDNAFGNNGLNGLELPEPDHCIEDEPGVDWIIRTVRQADPQTITLCATGPLTTVAEAFREAPDVAERLAELVVMGGAFNPQPRVGRIGNITEFAEFNFYMDPLAAHEVMQSKAKITIFPMDVTHQLISTPDRMDRVRSIPTFGDDLAKLVGGSEEMDLDKFKLPGAAMHDPCTVLYMLQPDLFSGIATGVHVTHDGSAQSGQAHFMDDDSARITVMTEIPDSDAAYDLLIDRLSRLVEEVPVIPMLV